MSDSKGFIWFGSEGGGLSKFDGNQIINYTKKDGLINNYVLSLLEDSKGNIWIGSDEGIVKFDGDSFTKFTRKEGIINSIIYSISEDSKGNIWFGTNAGAIKYDGSKIINFTNVEGFVLTNVESIVSNKYFFSFPMNLGTCNGINSFVLNLSFVNQIVYADRFLSLPGGRPAASANSNVNKASSIVGVATASSTSSAHPVEIEIIPTIKAQLKNLISFICLSIWNLVPYVFYKV